MNKTKFFSSLLVVMLFATASVLTSCKDYDDDIKKLQDAVDTRALKSDLESLKTSLESQISTVQSSLNTKIEALQTAVNSKADQSTVDALSTQVSNLASQLTALTTKVETIEAALDEYAKKADVETLATALAVVEGRVTALEEAIKAANEGITNEEAARKAADQAIQESITNQENAIKKLEDLIKGNSSEIASVKEAIEALKLAKGDLEAVKKLQDDLDAAKKALEDFKAQYASDLAAAKVAMQSLSEKLNSIVPEINILEAFVQKRVTSMVLMPNFYWEGVEGIEVPFANPEIFVNKKEEYKFTYRLTYGVAAGDQTVDVKVESTMGYSAGKGTKFVYTEKQVVDKGPWDEVNFSGEAGPTNLNGAIGNILIARQNLGKVTIDQTTLSNGAVAKYHINPTTADLSNATISFFENNSEVYTRTIGGETTNQNKTIAATPKSSAVDGEITTFKNGILTVPFTVKTDEVFKMFAAWASTGSTALDPVWDTDNDGSYGNAKTLPFISAQIETADTTITSDYAVVVPAEIEIIALADNNPEAKINGRDTEFAKKDVTKIRANHLYETVGYTNEEDQQSYGAIPMPATHTVKYDAIFNFDFIETHYNYTTYTRYGMSTQDKVMTADDMKALGLHYEYTLVNYIMGNNVTGESVHMEQVDKDGNPVTDKTSPYFAPRSVTADGQTISGKVATREAIDREPLVRVDLVTEDGKIVRYGYVKIRIVEDKADDMEVTIPLTEMYMNCGDEGRVTWSQMENLILAKLNDNKGITKQEFEKNYYLDVVGNYENMPYVNPSAIPVSDPSGTLYSTAAANQWMAKRYYKDSKGNYVYAQDLANDDAMTKLSKFTADNNWFGRVWYTPHDNATAGHNWDESTNVLIWNLMGEEDLTGDYADAGNMTAAAYAKLITVAKATYLSKGLNKQAISTVVRFINKNNGTSIYVKLLLEVDKIHFAYADINRRVLDHWYSKTEGYRDGVADTIEVYANVPTPAEHGKYTLETYSFHKDLKEYWLKQEIVPELHGLYKADGKTPAFNKFWDYTNKKFIGATYFRFTLPVKGENADFSADSKGQWVVNGASGAKWTVELSADKSEIQAVKKDGKAYTATTIVKMNPDGNIWWMGRDQTVTGSLVSDKTTRSEEYINEPANDILNYIGMYDAQGNKQREYYLTNQENKTFTAFVEIEVDADYCYEPLIGDTRFNVRFLRPINVWPAETKWTDAPNETQIYDIWKLLYIRDWRTYAVVMDKQTQKFADDGKNHKGEYSDTNMDVPYSFYGIQNLYIKRSEIRSDAYLEPAKRVKLTDPAEIEKLYSIQDIPALTNNVTGQEYFKLVDAGTSADAAGTMWSGNSETDSSADLIAYTNNGGVVKPFYVYVPISVEYSWGALIPWTQRVWAVIYINPTVGNE